jgi:4-diphosphocytidyl-2-C-methyl-D-erythritol kinase
MSTVRVPAYAKLNLYLEILGRAAEGFHALESIFQSVGLADYLTIRLAGPPGITLTCDDASLPVDAGNLAFRAAAAFCAGHEATIGGVHMTLEKNIPHGAGLGGGSSDAAAVLRVLAHFFPHLHTSAALHALAARLGSDVPYFLRGGTRCAAIISA